MSRGSGVFGSSGKALVSFPLYFSNTFNMNLSSLLMSKLYFPHLPFLSLCLSWEVLTCKFRLRSLSSSVGFTLRVLRAYTGAVESTGLRRLSSDRHPGEVLTSSVDVVSDLPLAKLVCSTPRNCSGRRQVVTALSALVFHHVRVFS